jgi:hypothetical protein
MLWPQLSRGLAWCATSGALWLAAIRMLVYGCVSFSPWLLGCTWLPPNGPPSWVALPCFTPQRVRCAAATSLMFCLCLVRDLVLPSLGKSVSCDLMTDVLLLLFSVSNFFSAFLFFFVPLPTPPFPSVCQMRCRRAHGRCVHFVLALRVFLCVPSVRQIHPRYLRNDY